MIVAYFFGPPRFYCRRL